MNAVKDLQLPKRPDQGGTFGRKSRVATNFFKITELAALKAYQYDVKMAPQLPMDKARRVFRQCEKLLKDQKGSNVWFVFDGLKNAFSTAKMADKWEGEVFLDKNFEHTLGSTQSGSSGRGGRGGARSFNAPTERLPPLALYVPSPNERNPEKISVTIELVEKEINLKALLDIAKGKPADNEAAQHAATCLSVVLRYVPSLIYVPVGSNFFTSADRITLSGGLEVWRGYHQSVRVMMAGHLGINVDLVSSVFTRGGIDLIEYIMEVCQFNRPDEIAHANHDMLSKALKDVNVVTTHRGEVKQRFKIKRLSKDSAATAFFAQAEGQQMISVEQYFKDQYNLRLKYPNLPLVLKGNKKSTSFPMEILKIVPGEKYKKRLNGAATAEMIKATCQKPEERRNTVQQGVNNTLMYHENDYLASFGLQVDSRMMEISARILQSPKVVYQNTTRDPEKGSWNLKQCAVIDAPDLKSMAFVFFVKTNIRNAGEVADKVLFHWRAAGMKIQVKNPPIIICNPSIPNNVKGSLMEAFKASTTTFKTRCQLVVCIVDGSKELYENIKRTSLCEAGLITQCMKVNNVYPASAIKPQYMANVALKANIKLGGANNYINQNIFKPETMFVGISISHAGPGSSAPSLATLASSIDKNATIYSTFVRAIAPRTDLVTDIGGMFKSALSDYMFTNKTYPKSVLIYREGIPTGRVGGFIEKEVSLILGAIEEMNVKCKVSVVTFQKKHNIRIFPVDHSDKDRSGNCCPGTVVDTDVMHPTDFNFVLQSHAGIQGMSRPTIYQVVYDENGLTSDEIQHTTYQLCYLSERATKAISVPAPAYRASIAASYSTMFLNTDGSDTASYCSGGQETLEKQLQALAAGMEQSMYYM